MKLKSHFLFKGKFLCPVKRQTPKLKIKYTSYIYEVTCKICIAKIRDLKLQGHDKYHPRLMRGKKC